MEKGTFPAGGGDQVLASSRCQEFSPVSKTTIAETALPALPGWCIVCRVSEHVLVSWYRSNDGSEGKDISLEMISPFDLAVID